MPGDPRNTEFRGWQRWWPFALLCVVKGSRWIFSEALPGSGSSSATEALGCASAAALCLWMSAGRGRIAADRRQIVRAIIAGALLVAAPALWLFARSGISGAIVAMALALTPVVLAVIDAAAGHTGDALAGRLWPGLAAIAGLLLLLAAPSLANPGADILLIAMPLLTGCGAALFSTANRTTHRTPLALFGASAAFALVACIKVTIGQGMGWSGLPGLATGLDALEAFLCVLALDRVSSTRWSAQFAVVPLVVLLEGVALMHSAVAPRMVVGLLLLAAASAALLLPPSSEPILELGVPRAEPRRSD